MSTAFVTWFGGRIASAVQVHAAKVIHACTYTSRALQAKERSRLEAQLAEAEQRLAAAQREREEEEARLSAATDSVEGARLARESRIAGAPARGLLMTCSAQVIVMLCLIAAHRVQACSVVCLY